MQNMSLLSLCVLLSAFSLLTVTNASPSCRYGEYFCESSNSCLPSKADCLAFSQKCRVNALGKLNSITDQQCDNCRTKKQLVWLNWPCEINPPRCEGKCGETVARLTVEACRFKGDYWCETSKKEENSCLPSEGHCLGKLNQCAEHSPFWCDYPKITKNGKSFPPNKLYCSNEICRRTLPRCVSNERRCYDVTNGCLGSDGKGHFCAHSKTCVTSRHACLSLEKGCRGGEEGIRATGGEYWCELLDKCVESKPLCRPPPPCSPNALGVANWLSFEACQKCENGHLFWPCDFNPPRCAGKCGSMVEKITNGEGATTPKDYPTPAGYQTRPSAPTGPVVGECKANALGVSLWLTDASCKICFDGGKNWPCKFNPPRCIGDCGPTVAAIVAANNK